MRLSFLIGSTCLASVLTILAACGSEGGAPSTPGDGDGGTPVPTHDAALPDAGTAPAHDAALPDAGPPSAFRGQGGGDVEAIAIVSHLAYITIGPRLTIWDVTDPAAPALRGETEPFAGDLAGVAVVGTHAYVTQENDLDGSVDVIDVSDPTKPTAGKSLRLTPAGTSTTPLGIAADATHLYVADQEHGVNVLDLTDPASPGPVKVLDLPGVSGAQVIGTRLYAMSKGFTDDMGVEAYDLSAGLKDLGGSTFTGAGSLAITTTNIALAVGIDGLKVRDLSDLASPKDLTITGATFNALSIAAGTNAAWVNAFDGLYPIDLSTPGTAVVGARMDVATEGGEATAVAGNLYALVTDRGRLVTLDVSTPTAPVTKATVDISLCTDCGGMAFDGDSMIIADKGNGLRTGHLSDLGGLGRGYMSKNIDFEDVAYAAGKAYVADWFFGMRVYDVSTPGAVKALGTVVTGGSPAAAAIENGVVYIGESTNGGALRAIDVADPNAPKLIGSVATSFALGLRVQNKIAYVADGTSQGATGGLHIFDVSSPAAMKQIGSYEEAGALTAVAIDRSTAVIAGENGWDFVDVTTPSAPKKLAHVDVKSPNAASAVAISGTRAYLGHTSGLIVVDITKPAQPAVVSERALPYAVTAIAITKPGHVVAACARGGVYQWDVP